MLVGQRRVGKSILLQLLKDYLLKNNPNNNVIYLNKEYNEYSSIAKAQDLYDYVSSRLKPAANNYLLVDEVQDIEDYETALRSLHAEEKCQIVATGSNAYIFSSEISTKLAGRYVKINVHSLTYREFLNLHQLPNTEASLLTYLRIGGLPGLARYDINDEALVRDYLLSVYNTVMMRDVISRAQIRNVSFLENLVKFVADNIGKPVSIKKISHYMASIGMHVSEPLITSYLGHLCAALIMKPIPRYNLHGKGLLGPNGKYYFSDHGLRNLLTGFNLRESMEKIMENVVHSHLLTQGFSVEVGLLQKGEIGFVATKGERRLYVQVAYLISGKETEAREFGNLFAIQDNYPKYVVSLDPLEGTPSQYPGILHVNLREFLSTDLA